MTRPHRRLIVNADDLGRTDGINSGIFDAHEKGIVTSATLMVMYPAAAEAAAALADHPDLGVGLHVQLSGGTPLLPAATVPSLVDAAGRFPAKPEGLEGASADQIRVEVEAQFERFLELVGRLPTHLDGHHHCLRRPLVCEALIEIARRHRLPIRRASPTVADWLEQTGVATTDAFVEDFYGPEVQLEVLLRLLRQIGDGSTELMVHPGRSSAALRESSSYADQREAELLLLTHPEVLAAVEELALDLTHFGQL